MDDTALDWMISTEDPRILLMLPWYYKNTEDERLLKAVHERFLAVDADNLELLLNNIESLYPLSPKGIQSLTSRIADLKDEKSIERAFAILRRYLELKTEEENQIDLGFIGPLLASDMFAKHALNYLFYIQQRRPLDLGYLTPHLFSTIQSTQDPNVRTRAIKFCAIVCVQDARLDEYFYQLTSEQGELPDFAVSYFIRFPSDRMESWALAEIRDRGVNHARARHYLIKRDGAVPTEISLHLQMVITQNYDLANISLMDEITNNELIEILSALLNGGWTELDRKVFVEVLDFLSERMSMEGLLKELSFHTVRSVANFLQVSNEKELRSYWMEETLMPFANLLGPRDLQNFIDFGVRSDFGGAFVHFLFQQVIDRKVQISSQSLATFVKRKVVGPFGNSFRQRLAKFLFIESPQIEFVDGDYIDTVLTELVDPSKEARVIIANAVKERFGDPRYRAIHLEALGRYYLRLYQRSMAHPDVIDLAKWIVSHVPRGPAVNHFRELLRNHASWKISGIPKAIMERSNRLKRQSAEVLLDRLGEAASVAQEIYYIAADAFDACRRALTRRR